MAGNDAENNLATKKTLTIHMYIDYNCTPNSIRESTGAG